MISANSHTMEHMMPANAREESKNDFIPSILSSDFVLEEFFIDEYKDFNWKPAKIDRTIDRAQKAAKSLNRFFSLNK